ncbi:hypothetical protein [Rhodovulum kholense]|uniref:Uncharacterized protein n=3 Tax=Rhodovulum TaxID=34008 RepID=A0A8E2VIE5_9RHOB|nr:hypothetical protein [Rhodovulum kholense]PTW47645.1 hypothetical protein C8N38_1092 [Rhodovulum kholense]RAP41612.1 hypothetical protein BYZ73_08345 [Rhodovulum viride]
MIRTAFSFPLLAGLLFAAPAPAADGDAAMAAFLENAIRPWAAAPVVIEAVEAQNAVTGGYSQEKIDELDAAWRAQLDSGSSDLISAVTDNAAAEFLRSQVDASNGKVTEVIVMDARGLNVATSGVTSDYWQGDEDKYSMTYSVGPDAVHFGEIELDESTQRYQAQISFTLVDPDSGAPIGAMTVAVDGAALF